MKYNVAKKTLYSNDGLYIKELECPLFKRWENLTPHPDTHIKRRCNDCHKFVIDISDFSDDQVIALIQVNPSSCFYIRSDTHGIDIEYEPHRDAGPICTAMDGMYNGCRIIRTARDLGEINEVERSIPDHHLIVFIIDENDEIREKIQVEQNESTGEYYLSGDYRAMSEPWDTKWHHPRQYTSPISAYIVPDDIVEGEKVFIPDLIQEFVGERWNQGDCYKVKSCHAIWNGDGFEYEIESPGEFIG